jgi:hypothetical protein
MCTSWVFKWVDILEKNSRHFGHEPNGQPPFYYISKTTNLPQVTDKLYHIMLYRVHLARVRFKLTTLVVIGTDCRTDRHDIPEMLLKVGLNTINQIYILSTISIITWWRKKLVIVFGKKNWRWKLNKEKICAVLIKHIILTLKFIKSSIFKNEFYIMLWIFLYVFPRQILATLNLVTWYI